MSPTSRTIRCLVLASCMLLNACQCLGQNQTLLPGNNTKFAIGEMTYGVHVFALSQDGFVVHQVAHAGGPNASGVWYQMPNSHQGSTPSGGQQTYDSDPIVGQNSDGRLEIFARSHNNLDFWHWFQVNASDPWTWVGPREPACLCNFPPCLAHAKGIFPLFDQKKCGNNVNCGNDGYDCSAAGYENSGPKWWNSQAIFPTSDGTFVNVNGQLQLYYRGFDGLMYSVMQLVPGNSTKYTAPTAWGTLLE